MDRREVVSGPPKRLHLLGPVVLLTMLVVSPSHSAVTIGSNLTNPAGGGVCGFGSFIAADFRCTFVQTSQTLDVATGGLMVPSDGVMVRWRVKLGTLASDITRFAATPQVLRANTGGAKGDLVELPLDDPGVHQYDTRLPVKAGDSVGLQTDVTTDDVSGGNSPITYCNSGAGTLNRYSGGIDEGEFVPIDPVANCELLLNGDIEPDADHDGFGDETQDQCPTNTAIQGPCPDTTPPTATISLSNAQNLVAQKAVIVSVSSNEAGAASASGTLEVRRAKTTYPLSATTVMLNANELTTLFVELPDETLKAAKKGRRRHKKVAATVTVQVRDAAGNASGATQVTVRATARH